MNLELIRTYFPEGTNATMLFNGAAICSTIELPWNNNPTFSFAQAGQTCYQSAVVHVSAIVPSDVTLLSNSNNMNIYLSIWQQLGQTNIYYPACAKL